MLSTHPRPPPHSPTGAAFATLVVRARTRIAFTTLWSDQSTTNARRDIATSYITHISTRKNLALKATSSTDMLGLMYAAYGLDKLLVLSEDFFHNQLNAWYEHGPRRDYLALYA